MLRVTAARPSDSGPPGGTPALGCSPGTRMVARHSNGNWVGGVRPVAYWRALSHQSVPLVVHRRSGVISVRGRIALFEGPGKAFTNGQDWQISTTDSEHIAGLGGGFGKGRKKWRRPLAGPSLRDTRRRIPVSPANQVAGTWLVRSIYTSENLTQPATLRGGNDHSARSKPG